MWRLVRPPNDELLAAEAQGWSDFMETAARSITLRAQARLGVRFGTGCPAGLARA
jgi:hypothetical protein